MDNVKMSNDLFISDNFEYIQVNKVFPNINNASIIPCLKKSQKLLKNLEASLIKTSEYEDKLLKCKRNHYNYNNYNEQRRSEVSEPTKNDCSTTNKIMSPRNRIDIGIESWSTMSVVCLQYQYEELSKRYETLLQKYDEQGNALNTRNAALLKLRKRMNKTHLELAYLNKTLLCVGEKYLTLKYKKISQKTHYEEKIDRLKQTLCEVLLTVEKHRLELKEQLTRCMSVEHDSAVALLLGEIKKCNSLLLENLHLKSKLEFLS